MRETDPETLRAELDRCVKCGMCLPECPTYRLTGNEAESPRGRIALMEGLSQGRLPGDPALAHRHLDTCLGCRRCERVCPSGVHYGEIIDAFRQQTRGPALGGLGRLVQHPGLQAAAARVARRVPAALSRALAPLHRMHLLARALPPSGKAPEPGLYAPAGSVQGRVGLFAGCTGVAYQAGALRAAVALLLAAGYEVLIPGAAGCCGALAAHSGDPDSADALAAANRSAFPAGLDAIVSIASGCGIQLDSYRPPLPAPHRDISRFLAECGGLSEAGFAPLQTGPVHLHTPCSMENVYRGAAHVRTLLDLVPGLKLQAVGEPGQCCGSAGDYMLRYPATAAELRRPLIERLQADNARILLTSNVGCAMHIAAGIVSVGLDTEVLHPVELLARQLVAAHARGR
jgi:glycolate oxidase iron-sulfur subunit